MPDNPKPQVEFKFDETKFKDKIVSLTSLKEKYVGKEGYNPYLWFGIKVQPYIDRYQKGERSKELYDAAISIDEVVPPISGNKTINV